MERLIDDLSKRLADTRSRREAFRLVCGALMGGLAAACQTTTPTASCATNECLGSDGVCYGPCSGNSYCTTNPGNLNCSSPSAGGVYCCSAPNPGGGTSFCPAGSCYIRSAFICCPSGYLNYGGAGYGCFATRAQCLDASGGKCWYETSCIA
jgi:hypothetical protein